jgi:hypothetical protein
MKMKIVWTLSTKSEEENWKWNDNSDDEESKLYINLLERMSSLMNIEQESEEGQEIEGRTRNWGRRNWRDYQTVSKIKKK